MMGATLLTKEGIYERLRRCIVVGDMAPGTRLTEQVLADRYEVSRTPIREALTRLNAEGFVIHRPHRGALVREFSLQEILDMYDLRVMLEGYTARRATTCISEDQIDALERNHEQSLQAQELLAGTTDPETFKTVLHELLELNYYFHNMVARASGNLEAVTILERLHYLPLLYRILAEFGVEGRNMASQHHEQMIDAFRQRDPVYAEHVMRLHVYFGRQGVLASLES